MQIIAELRPLGDVGAGNARLALVAADAFFDVSTPAPTRNEAFEAVAPVGQNLIHVITRLDGPTNLGRSGQDHRRRPGGLVVRAYRRSPEGGPRA